MVKKCLICGEAAVYSIKDTSDFYCTDCAEEQFGDLSLLVKIDSNQKKNLIDERHDNDENDDECADCENCKDSDDCEE